MQIFDCLSKGGFRYERHIQSVNDSSKHNSRNVPVFYNFCSIRDVFILGNDQNRIMGFDYVSDRDRRVYCDLPQNTVNNVAKNDSR